MYRRKYEKYKSKYIQLKKLMYGGTPENDMNNLTYGIYYDKSLGKYKGIAVFQPDVITSVKEKLAKTVTGSVVINMYDSKFNCLFESTKIYDEKTDDIVKIISKIEIKLIDKIILQIECSDGERTKSINNIYKDDIVIGIIDGRISKDRATEKYVIESSELTINKDVKINCDLTSYVIKDERHIRITNINQIKVKECTFKFDPPYGTVMEINDIINLFTENEYSIREQIDKIKLKGEIANEYIVSEIVNLFYNNYVFIVTKKCGCDEFIKYGNYINFMINNDIDKFKDHINRICKTDIFKREIINNMTKKVPAFLETKLFLFKNSIDNFVSLPDSYNILFDSGNASFTLISQSVIDILKLKVINGCLLGTGFGGRHICNGYVEVEFKFVDSFPLNNNKKYKSLAFISNDIGNGIVFGNIDVLKQMYDDNFVISKEYSDNNIKLRDKEYSSYNKKEKILKTISKIISDFMDQTLMVQRHYFSNSINEVILKNYNELLVEIISQDYEQFAYDMYKYILDKIKSDNLGIFFETLLGKYPQYKSLIRNIINSINRIQLKIDK
jgi:hypothetical protein